MIKLRDTLLSTFSCVPGKEGVEVKGSEPFEKNTVRATEYIKSLHLCIRCIYIYINYHYKLYFVSIIK